MLKRMSLRLACTYSNCNKMGEPPNVFGMGPALSDDAELFRFKRMRMHLTPIPKQYRRIGIFHTYFSPVLPKRCKYSKRKYGGRNRIYTRLNMRLFERRRLTKAYKIQAKK